MNRGDTQWTIARFFLGVGQMVCATMAFTLLVSTGVNRYSLTAAGVTTLMTVVSVVVFRRGSEQPDR